MLDQRLGCFWATGCQAVVFAVAENRDARSRIELWVGIWAEDTACLPAADDAHKRIQNVAMGGDVIWVLQNLTGECAYERALAIDEACCQNVLEEVS